MKTYYRSHRGVLYRTNQLTDYLVGSAHYLAWIGGILTLIFFPQAFFYLMTGAIVMVAIGVTINAFER